MNRNNYDFAIIGGDMRQVYMMNDLINRNYSVITYGLPDLILDFACIKAKTLTEAISSSLNIILPIPVSKDGVNIISGQSYPDLTIEGLCNQLTSNHKLYGGCLTNIIKNHCNANGIFYNDLMEKEEIVLFNTIATAEGALAEAISNSTINLQKSNCVIIGFGKCARTLAEKLKNLCGHLDIAARSSLALSAANAASYGTVNLSQLNDSINKYDFIFNTVPAMVLPKELLINTKLDVTIIDIASNPGGVDCCSAKELNRNAKLCLGLPGKYAPKSSAICLTNYILSDLRK
jgi:dipicolinate synthase subunit A